MKKLITTMMALLACASLGTAAEGEWLHDYKAAKAQAAEQNKPILINFTGSDWCGWCIKLEKEVFKKEEFQKYAKKHLVLMEVDFPNKKEQSEEVKEQNEKLDKQFKIEGYPTVFLIDAEEKKISEDIGYREGGPAAYVEHLKSLLEKKE